ncbi:N-acyl-L-amino acid amidohydrolase [Rhodopirellula islandica]|uniref:N-acyl-L-amino acid amidohydrolase n=1 Tax=Rhodopirellula islandica TaxID=595434 RepID=A0A0J1BHQ3_RHOIS|nr:M20 family metallopeptidase [Rhodopirellula islandica]KLU06023.1 N-acyl-L-amino acid amidohydrolase [Rhodopirellula islandica]
MMIEQSLLDRLQALSRSHAMKMREVRRYLHRHPELSGQEYRSTDFLAEIVTDLGLHPKLADDNRGLYVDIGEELQLGRTAIRADIDALPIQSLVQQEYASDTEQVMHACGHDAHSAIAYGVAAILAELARDGFPVNSRVIFQPEEETSRGGLHMIRSGALQGVRSAIALHVDPTRPVGTIGIREGAFTAGCDLFTVEMTGPGGHGARPHLTGDLVGAASQWVTDIYRRVPRAIDARDAVVINVGSFHTGNAPNVVPSNASLSGTLRTLSSESAERAKEMMAEISRAIASIHSCRIDLNFGQHTPPVINDVTVARRLRKAGEEILGEANVREITQPSMGAEDFAFMAQQVPAAMFRLGVAGMDLGSEPLHTPKFDIDESALPIGASVLALAAFQDTADSDSSFNEFPNLNSPRFQ